MLVFRVSREQSPSKQSGKSTLASQVNFALAEGSKGLPIELEDVQKLAD